ncbi:hypothetical protein H0H87_006885 [Tephrocybe sp. NHM501043]|nr:hypothetical protein H0H87_006885 [Tephrocybe sp. NHM501043]
MPALFALIIGIDQYRDPRILDLRGAVNDANAVEDYLVFNVGVSKDRLMNLRDEGATRKGILQALKSLVHHGAIREQDPILIYYAGHGSEAQCCGQEARNVHTMIKMLVPHDFCLEGSNDEHGQGIFDVTLCQILNDIATNKSDNIVSRFISTEMRHQFLSTGQTVICDCCHSGFRARKNASLDAALAVRGIELPPNYTIPLHLFGSELVCKSSRLSSHVLLLACGKEQFAIERQGRGSFTSALLSLLEQEGTDKLTYMEVMSRMRDIPSQNPQCKGVHKNRILFDHKVHSRQRTVYGIYTTPEKKNQYTLQAGEAHGVAKGALFDVYSDRLATCALGSVVTIQTNPVTSQCSVYSDTLLALSQPSYAIQSCVGEGPNVRLFIEPNDELRDLFTLLGEHDTTSHERSFHLVNDWGQPDLVIRTDKGQAQIEIKDPICCQYGLRKMPFDDVRAADSHFLFSILRSAAHFYWYLHYPNDGCPLAQKVHIECLEVEPSGGLTDNLEQIFLPIQNSQNLLSGNIIFIDVDNYAAIYGYAIHNTSETPLYAALFYFDISDLSICKLQYPFPY